MDKVRIEIQERAINALDAFDIELFYHFSELTRESFKDGYEQGATEQKAIDEADLQTAKQTYFDAGYEKGVSKTIDKACEWLKNNLGYYDRHEVHIGKSYEEVVIDDFKKAMEE